MTAYSGSRLGKQQYKTFKLSTIAAAMLALSAHVIAEESAKEESDEVVIVTGERVERTIYDTSASVTVFDEGTLSSVPRGSELNDILRLAPNLVFTGNDNNLPTVRGIDGSGPSVGGLASFAGTSTRLNFSIDGRSLTYSEVAFGPRSLWDVEQVETYVGPQSLIQGQSSSAGAIIVTTKKPTYFFEAKGRMAAGDNEYGQLAGVISAPIIEDKLAFRLAVDSQTKKSHVDLESYVPVGDPRLTTMNTIRGKVLFEPSSSVSNLWSVTYMDSRAPQSENVPHPVHYPAKRPVYDTKSTTWSWDFAWEINDFMTFEQQVLLSEFEYDRITNPERKANFFTEGDEFHIEPILNLNFESLTGLIGLRWFKSSQDDYFDSRWTSAMSGETETQSLFTEFTWSAADVLDLTFGGRFEHERKKRNVPSPIFLIDHDAKESIFLPKFDVAFKPNNRMTYGFKVSKGFNSGGAGLSFSVDNTGLPKTYAFDTEYVWNYEAYTRLGSEDGASIFTANVFYNDYEDMQVQQAQSDKYVMIVNLKDAQTYGGELAATLVPNENLDVFANIGLVKTEFKETAAQGGKKRELPRAPQLTVAAGLNYYAGDFEIGGNATYTGKYFSDLDNSSVIAIDPYLIANAQVAYNFENGRATLYAKNLFDTEVATYYFATDATDAPLNVAPRTVGVTVELTF